MDLHKMIVKFKLKTKGQEIPKYPLKKKYMAQGGIALTHIKSYYKDNKIEQSDIG